MKFVVAWTNDSQMEFKFVEALTAEAALIATFGWEVFNSLYEDYDDGEDGQPDSDMMLEELFNQEIICGYDVIPESMQRNITL